MNIDREELIQYLIDDFYVHNNCLDEWEEARLFYVLIDKLGIDFSEIDKGYPSSDAVLERIYLSIVNKLDRICNELTKEFKNQFITEELKFIIKDTLMRKLKENINNKFLSEIDINIFYYSNGDLVLLFSDEDGEEDIKQLIKKHYPLF